MKDIWNGISDLYSGFDRLASSLIDFNYDHPGYWLPTMVGSIFYTVGMIIVSGLAAGARLFDEIRFRI